MLPNAAWEEPIDDRERAVGRDAYVRGGYDALAPLADLLPVNVIAEQRAQIRRAAERLWREVDRGE